MGPHIARQSTAASKRGIQHWSAHVSVCDGSRSPESLRSSSSISLSAMLAGTPRNSASNRRSAVVAVHESQVVGYVLGSNAPALNGRRSVTVPDVWPYFEQGFGFLVQHYDRYKYPLPQPLHYFYCAASYRARANFNRAAAALFVQHKDGPLIRWTNWPGTLLILKFVDASCDSYADVTEEDIENVRAFFQIL
ncbi:uncharacterized protein TRAVEDRAFT_18358 [Trametes versicolor FP-101664 SS1]|uniref:uncharacterized protein n=1 Tax=Trametes versicolor (strain FP-101664) TaxID=717944 RepID=UPI00046232A6|nr:uncharacterized protein TRAVEDRAFT_18358 [Trametes versicolor FP-101664 SS1]EIW61758.1 hypothetical protein TRAVEDRAFT_18358 [Trametes versicolor FP-101664 SS1]